LSYPKGDHIAPKPIPPEFLACVETVLTAQPGEAKKLQQEQPLYSQSWIHPTLQEQTHKVF
jgi:hypothetical protein